MKSYPNIKELERIHGVAYLSLLIEDDEEEGPGVEIDAGIESGVGGRLEVAHESLRVKGFGRRPLGALLHPRIQEPS